MEGGKVEKKSGLKGRSKRKSENEGGKTRGSKQKGVMAQIKRKSLKERKGGNK